MKQMLVVIVLMGTLVLNACGGAPAAPSASAVPAATTAQGVSGEQVELTYMMWGSPEELAVWQTIVDEFHAANPQINVKVEVTDWDSYWSKLLTLSAGGTPPDVFAMDGPFYPDWATRGVLLDLTPYIEKTPGLLDGLYPNTLTTYRWNDGYYGLPRDLQPIVLFYNQDMFDKAGLAYPTDAWTMDDLRTAAKQLTIDTDGDGKIDQWGFSPELGDMELFWSEAIWGYGGEILSADYAKTTLAEGPGREALKFIDAMANQDKSLTSPSLAAEYGEDPFAAGVAAMSTSGHWVVPEYAPLDFKWNVAPMPAGPAGRSTSVNSAGLVVSNATPHPDAAWEFVKFAVSSEGQTRLTELGFAVPILKSIAESPVFLEQAGPSINQQVFLDSLSFARAKPSFKGYEEWAAAVSDGMLPVWNGEAPIDPALDALVPLADEVLAKNK